MSTPPSQGTVGQQLTRTMLLTGISGAAVMLLAFLLILGSFQEREQEAKFSQLVALLAHTLDEPTHARLEPLARHPAFRRAWVLSSEAEVLAHRHADQLQFAAPPQDPGDRVQTGTDTILVGAALDGPGRLLAEFARRDKAARLGELLLLALPLLLGLLFCYVVARRLAARMARPIVALAQTAKEIREHQDYSVRAQGSGSTEIDILVDAFNTMLVAIADRSSALASAQSRAELRVAEAEAAQGELACTLDSIADGLIATDEDGRVRRMNPVAEELCGCSEKDARGYPLGEVLSLFVQSEPRRPIRWNHEALLSNAADLQPDEGLRLVARDGSEFAVAAQLHPIRDGQQRHLGTLLVCRDISAQVALEDRLLQSQKMQAVGQLAGGIAHDFNNLLTSIRGYGELLPRLLERQAAGQEEAGRQIEEYLQAIQRSTNQAADLSTQLLSFSRRQRSRLEDIDANEMAGSVCEMVRRTIDAKVQVQLDLDPVPGMVRADPAQLESAILNLCLNARDAMPEGGRLEIRTRSCALQAEDLADLPIAAAPGRYLCFQVKDQGRGMDEEEQARMFDPFFTSKRAGEGTGLGLASVYGMVEKHHGSIRVRSTQGSGTEVNLFLPLSDSLPSMRFATAEPSQLGSGTILYVDDNAACRGVAELLLKELGYETFMADGSKSAMQIFRRAMERIRLVILDLQMPGQSGGELATELRTLDPDLPILFCSGEVPEHAVAQHLPGCHFLSKPYGLKSMAQAISATLALQPARA